MTETTETTETTTTITDQLNQLAQMNSPEISTQIAQKAEWIKP